MSLLSKIALTIGTAASLAAVASPAVANPYHGGGYGRGGYGNYGGYRGYGGYRHHDNSGAIVAGALLLGGIAAIAASSHNRDYDNRYRGDDYYRGDARASGYYDEPRGDYYVRRTYEERGYAPSYGDRYDGYGY